MSINQRIRERREELGLSQAALARKMGVSTTAVQHWESGHRPIQPRPARIRKLATVLEASEPWLIFGETEDASRRKPQSKSSTGLAFEPKFLEYAGTEYPLEIALLRAFRLLTRESQIGLVRFLKGLMPATTKQSLVDTGQLVRAKKSRV